MTTKASASEEMAGVDSLTSEEEIIYKDGDIPSKENDLNIKEFWQALEEKTMRLMNIFVKMTHFMTVLRTLNI